MERAPANRGSIGEDRFACDGGGLQSHLRHKMRVGGVSRRRGRALHAGSSPRSRWKSPSERRSLRREQRGR